LDTWQLLLVAFVALFVGISLPLLGMAFFTMSTLRKEVKTTAESARAVLENVDRTMNRVEGASRGLEGSGEKIASIVDSLTSFATSLDRLKSSVNVASAIGSAAGPAIAAFVGRMQAGSSTEGPHSGSADASRSSRLTIEKTNHGSEGPRGNGQNETTARQSMSG
jgi:hypothetical protein